MSAGTGTKAAVVGITILGLGLAFAFAGEGDKPDEDKDNAHRPPHGPIPLPGSDADFLLINQKICDCWYATGKPDDVGVLRGCLVEAMHPDVPFPPVPGDHQSVHAAWSIFTDKVEAFLAAPDKQAWCESLTGDDDTPLELLNEWESPTPMPGRFFLLEQGYSISKLAREALDAVAPGAGNNSTLRREYMHCLTSGPNWNLKYYASTSFSEQFPEWAGVNGVGLRRAFYPWHDDARAAIVQRREPTRAITQAGNQIPNVGNNFALLWLPPVDAEALAQGIVTCGSVTWNDGSSSIDPPPEILELVKKTLIQGSSN